MKWAQAVAIAMATIGVVCAAVADISGTGKKNDMHRFGLLSFLLSDGPVDEAEAVVMTFTGVELLGRGGSVVQALPIDPPLQVDVLKLSGRMTQTLLGDVALEAGEYDQLRLLVETPPGDCQNLVAPFASYVQIAGTQYPLVLPGDTDLTLRGQVRIERGGHSRYVIDLDLRQAITARGQTACFGLRPGLRLAEVDSSGHIHGQIDPDLLGAEHCDAAARSGKGSAVYVFEGEPKRLQDIGPGNNGPLATTSISKTQEGVLRYELGYVPVGDYTVALTCQSGADDPRFNDAVQFEASSVVTVGPEAEVQVNF